MPVYVDPLFEYGGSATFRWKESCHCFADTEEELHALMKRIGMKRAWFQNKRDLPHYDLNEGRRKAAVKAGAIEVEFEFMVEFMATRRKKRVESNRLLAALQFLSLCQSNKGDDRQIYCVLSNHFAVASDGILTLGHPIEEDLEACPHTANMILALKRCGETFAITQHPESLQIVSGDFQAFVPCIERSRLPESKCDALAMPVDERLTACLDLVAPLANEKSEHVLTASIKIQAGSVIATNREIITEAWHGLNLPNVIIPKYAATSIIKSGKKLSGFGFNIDGLFPATEFQSSSVTFYFEDGSWLKTQVYKLHQWPADVSKLIDVDPRRVIPRPIKEVFIQSVQKVLPFSPNGLIWCADTTVSSHNHWMENAGAKLTLEVSDAPKGRCYVGKNLLLMPAITHIDETSLENVTLFWGNNVRGAVYHRAYDWTADKEDIPF